MLYSSIFDTVFAPRPSVYVISDSQLAEWKREKAEAEILELDKLIESHEASIERLKATREELRTEYPAVAAAEEFPLAPYRPLWFLCN